MTPADLQSLIALRFPKAEHVTLFAVLLDEVLAEIWNAYPWRTSIKELPPFFLQTNEQDYGPPVYTVPRDFQSLEKAWIRTSDGGVLSHLVVIRGSSRVLAGGIPQSISYIPELPGFRIFPVPQLGSPNYWVEGRYKISPPRVANDYTLMTKDLPFDERWFHVVRQGLVAKYQRELGGISPQSQGEYATFRALLREMAAIEGVDEGPIQISPAERLRLGFSY